MLGCVKQEHLTANENTHPESNYENRKSDLLIQGNP